MTEEVKVPAFELHHGKIPAIGFGSGTAWQWKKKGRAEDVRSTLDEDLSNAIIQAIKTGFRHIDTAEFYDTHAEVGHAIKNAGVERSKLWITDKYSPGYRGIKARSENPYESVKTALKELDVEYIDLFLIHHQFFDPELTPGVTIEEAWKYLEKALGEGLVKNIGLSNFDAKHIDDILKIANHKPSILQIEFHPYLLDQTPGIIEYAKKNNILVEAYGPLTPLIRAKEGSLNSVLKELSEKYKKTEAQILLRWVYEFDILPITTSSNEQRLKDSLDIFNFELSQEDVALITKTGAEYPFRAFFTPDLGELN